MCHFRVERRSHMNRRLGGLSGQLGEFPGRQASIQPRTTHRRRLEDAMITPFITIGAGSGQQLLNRRTMQSVGSLSICNQRPQAGRARKRQGAHPQAGSSQPTKDESDTPGMGEPRSIEARNEIHAWLAHCWNKTRK
jgi:hypothetical protein